MTEDSNKTQSAEQKPPSRAGGRGPMGPSVAMEKPKNFKKSLGKLISLLLVDKLRAFLIIVFLIIAAGLASLGPRVLGEATNVLFNGLVSKTVTTQIEKSIPHGMTIDQVKEKVDKADGTMDSQKLIAMIEQFQNSSQKAQSFENSQTSNTSAAPNLSQISDMLSKMQIRLGSGVDWVKFQMMLLWIIIIYLGSLLTRSIAGWLSVNIIAKSSLKLRAQIEAKIWKLPLSYYDKTSRGEVMSRTTNDLDNVTQTLNQTGGDMIYMILMVLSVIAMMFSVSPLLACIALLTIPISGILLSFVMKKAQPRFKEQWAVTGKLNGIIEESFTGHSLIKVYGQQDEFQKNFNEQNERLYKAGFGAQFISGTLMPLMNFITNLNYVVIAFIGALRVASGNMTLGDVQAFIQYSRQYSQPLGQISQMLNMLQSGAASAERIFELLDAEEESDESELSDDKFETKGKIEFKDVCFSYNKDVELIKNMNLVAEPGKTIAIVGPTGAGKTTLVNLIMRFYEVDSGQILIDGIPTSQISRAALRKNVGMVLQDTWLFKGTIEENLKYGAAEGHEVTEAEFKAAVEATFVDRFVKALPDGYKTVLDSEGSAVSVGEKQLLTIARAFLADPDILILDEATSSVDTRTEVLVQKAMNKLKSNRTSFVIAHRLSTIRDADLIIMMENGSIVEQGNHDELISKGGRYASLYQSQFEGASTDNDIPEGGLFG